MADANVNTVSMTEKQKVKEITDKLEEGLKELFESEKYKNYLSTMSKFHNYSFNNTLLIALQRPDASLVAGYQAWQKNFNRHVKRGEKGIRILAPAPYKIKEERDKLDPVTGEVMLDKDGTPQTEEVEVKIPAFRAVSVFDVSQTDGEPLPELETKELLSTVEGYEDFIKAVTYVAPAPIGFEDIPGDSKGYFNIEENRIAVQEGMSESQTLKTMVHETAHSMLHNKEVNREDILAPAKDRNTKEIEAESIAFTVCRHFGIDTSEYSFSYIAGWSSGRDMKELKSSLDTIRRTASELITGIEEQLRELQRDREIMQEQSQELILAVSNTERSHFDIASVKGMEGVELMNSLLAMKDADRENVEAYLESRGAWVTHLGDDRSEEVEEFHVDYIYDTDTHAITDIKYAMEMDRKANEPIKDSDVVLKIMYRENDGYEIDKITNMTREQTLDLAHKLAALDENEWDGNIQDFMEENGAEYVPIIVKDGRNSGMPEFFDIAVDLKAEEVSLEKELSGMEYASSIIHRLEHGKGVFSPDERNLIVNYGYKLDDYEKTKELAEVLAYRIENEPANAALTVIDAQAEIDALPDGMIGLSEMHEYGYTWEEMLPLTKETALELFDRDLAVYQLHKDGSEALIEDKEQITGHDGIFGIEKGDWENERELRSIQEELAESSANKEAQLLYGNTDKYGIYQLKDNPELRYLHFEGTESLKKMGIIKDNYDAIKPENYNLIYTGELAELAEDYPMLQTQGDKLEALYEKFNIDHPADYKGHSLSVSDIVVLHENGKNSAHFVDSFGFTGLPDFMRELEGVKEQEADKAEKGLTNEEKQFLETDNAPLIAKNFLAWDEIEDLGYRFFEDGYIDKFKPSEKALYGDGMVPEPKIYDLARRMQGGEDIREELAKALIGGHERVIEADENDDVAVLFGRDAVTVTFGNAEKQISYEEMGTAFLGLMESEYKDIEQARAAEEQEEEIAESATSGHNVQRLETQQTAMEQSEPEQIQAGQAEAQKSYPAVYGHTLSYAMEHGEVDKYSDSRKLDRECREAIEGTIRQNFDGMHLKHDIVKPLAEQYGSERMAFVLASTIQQESWDGRFSVDNKAWASEFYIPENIVHGIDMNRELIVSSHPAVLDGFIDMFRSEVLEKEKELSIGQEKMTSGHDVQKLETEQTAMEQSEPEKPATPEFENMEDGDEIIDLGDETEQVLAEIKQSLEGRQDTSGHNVQKLETESKKEAETELAFQIADRFISIQETDGGYDYSIMGADYKEIDGGVYDNPNVSIREALNDILEDLKENPFDNGARGNISDNDELIPIDYDGLMEKVEAADHIEPQAQGNVVENFKAKTNELFHEISEMNPAEIEETVKRHVQAKIDEYVIQAEIIDVAVVGSRCRGLERESSDLDVAVELSTNEREDDLFNAFNNCDGIHIGGIKVDINPITAQRTGTLETYLPQVEDYLEGVREAREKEPVSIFNIRMNDEERWFKNTSGLDAEGLCKAYAECDKPFVEMGKYGEWIKAADHASIEQGDRLDFSIEFNEETDQITIFDGENFTYKGLRETLFPEQAEPEVTLTVAECGEFHTMGEFYENIPTVEEAVAIWKQIPPERMNGIPAIGVNIHTPGMEVFEDVGADILSGKRIDLDILEFIPDIKNSPQAMEVIAELVAKLPEMEIDGNMGEEFEAKVWEKRMPGLTPAEQLAVEIDRFTYDYDAALYHDNSQSMTENVSELADALKHRDTHDIALWLAEIAADGTEPEERKRAAELLEKMSEYKPLAKIEEMEEQNYNMVDNVLNNGAGEKSQKEENRKAQDKPAAKPSLKARLAEKKAQVAGQGREQEENIKNKQREM